MKAYIAEFIGPFPYEPITLHTHGDTRDEAEAMALELLTDLVKRPSEWEFSGLIEAYGSYREDEED